MNAMHERNINEMKMRNLYSLGDTIFQPSPCRVPASSSILAALYCTH